MPAHLAAISGLHSPPRAPLAGGLWPVQVIGNLLSRLRLRPPSQVPMQSSSQPVEPPAARVIAPGLPAPRASGAMTPRVAGSHKWRFVTPQGRYAAVCVTCVGTIEAKRPRIQAGNVHARSYHCACVASKLPADIAQVEGWDALSHIAKVQVRGELSTVAAAAFASGSCFSWSPEPVTSRHGLSASKCSRVASRRLDGLAYARATLIRHVPQACRAPVADLRAAIAAALHDPDLHGADAESEDLWKLFFFLDLLLFSPTAARAGRKGQHAEKPLAAITRRLRAAWEGKWLLLLAEAQQRAPDPTRPASAPTLASEVRAIQQALQEDDVRMAVRRLDGSAALAPPAKAARCLQTSSSRPFAGSSLSYAALSPHPPSLFGSLRLPWTRRWLGRLTDGARATGMLPLSSGRGCPLIHTRGPRCAPSSATWRWAKRLSQFSRPTCPLASLLWIGMTLRRFVPLDSAISSASSSIGPRPACWLLLCRRRWHLCSMRLVTRRQARLSTRLFKLTWIFAPTLASLLSMSVTPSTRIRSHGHSGQPSRRESRISFRGSFMILLHAESQSTLTHVQALFTFSDVAGATKGTLSLDCCSRSPTRVSWSGDAGQCSCLGSRGSHLWLSG